MHVAILKEKILALLFLQLRLNTPLIRHLSKKKDSRKAQHLYQSADKENVTLSVTTKSLAMCTHKKFPCLHFPSQCNLPHSIFFTVAAVLAMHKCSVKIIISRQHIKTQDYMFCK